MEKNNEPKLRGILFYEADDIWPLVLPLIQKAIHFADNKYKTEDILLGIKGRDIQLWVAEREGIPTTCMLTRIVKYPQEKSLLIMCYSGEGIQNMIHFEPIIRSWGKEHECTRIEIFGRKGWEKVLKDEGYEHIHTVLRMKI